MNVFARAMCAPCAGAVVLLLAGQAAASLTLLSGPQQGTHVGNLVTNGSFEIGAPPPNGPITFWATGTSNLPFSVPNGWTSSGGAQNYAWWGGQGGGPYQINGSDYLPDGSTGMYFGNLTTGVSQAPVFNANGTVSFANAPVFTPTYGQPVRLSQSVPTHLNMSPSYLLSFWVSGENSLFNGSWTDGVFGLRVSNVLPGDPVQYLAVPSGISALGTSVRFEYLFTPLNPNVPVDIEFINWGHLNSWPGSAGNLFTTELVLDDVIVNMVPVPGTGLVVLAGAMVGLRRRR